MNICMYRFTILFFCYIVELSPVNAQRASYSFAMLVDGVGSCIHRAYVRIIYITNRVVIKDITHLWAELVLMGGFKNIMVYTL